MNASAHTPSATLSPLLRRPRAATAVAAAAAALACALPSAATASSEASASVTSEPVNASLTVLDENGRSVDVLGKLTIKQLAAALHVSSAELVAEIEALPGYSSVASLLGEVLNPSATLSQVTSALSALGLSTGSLTQLIEARLSSLAQDAEALRALVAEILADLGLNGALPTLANELATTLNDLLEPQLVSSTTEGAASTLGTTAENLNSTLKAARAIVKPLVSGAPLVLETVEKALPGTTQVLATPSGGGGLTFTTVNSTSAPAAAGVQGAKFGSFSVLSVKVTKAGLIVERVFLPKPGVVDVKATAPVKSKRARKARTATLAKLASALSGGTHTLTLRPSHKGISAKRVRVGLRTTYTPNEGAPATTRNSLVYRFPKARHKH